MKKTFKIIISAIICMALLIVPMSVMAEEGIDYNINYETFLTEGTNNYAMDSNVPYTVYILYPTEVGDYTVTSNSKIGIVSYIDMWVQFEPTEENVNLNELTWTCTDVNQAIMIAISPNASEESITVTRKDSDTSDEIPWIIYENKTAPEKFEMPSFVDVDAFDDGYVDFEDDVIDDAVLGDDGYYHLNDKNGPVLFINLNDSIMSMYTMSGYGSLAAIHYDDDGKVIKKVDYTDAFNEYVAALPADNSGAITSFYYPLNADLIEMYKEIGTSHDWYSGDDAWVYASEDAWLFACYYDEDVTTMDPNANANDKDNAGSDDDKDDTTTDDTTGSDNTNGNINDNTGGNTNNSTNNNTSTDTSNKSPATGDNAVALALAMISAAAVVVGVKAKK